MFCFCQPTLRPVGRLGLLGIMFGSWMVWESLIRLPCENRPVVNTTGAGDAATAAIVWAGVHGLDLASTAAAALRAGAITAACPDTNSPGLCLDRD